MDYISGRTWAGDNSRSTIYQGFYCIIYDRNDSNFHYRISLTLTIKIISSVVQASRVLMMQKAT
jgi:hypothetical protein